MTTPTNPIPFNPQQMKVSELLEAAETLKGIYEVALHTRRFPEEGAECRIAGHVDVCLDHALRRAGR